METKRKSSAQYVELAEVLVSRPDVDPEELLAFYDSVAIDIHSHRPPAKASDHIQLWLDYKTPRATGGGRGEARNFDDLEEKIMQLCEMEACTYIYMYVYMSLSKNSIKRRKAMVAKKKKKLNKKKLNKKTDT